MTETATREQQQDQEDVLQMSEVLDKTVEETDGKKTTLGEMLESFDKRTYGPLLLILSLIAASPIGGIPGMSIVTGSLIILVAGQLLLLRPYPWMPGKLLSISFKRKRLTKLVDKIHPWTKWIQKIIHPRLLILTENPAILGIAVVCIGLAILFYPMALVPMAVGPLAATILVFSVGLTTRDGILIILGYILTGVAVYLSIILWPF